MVDFGWLVAEEVDVERVGGLRLDCRQLAAHRIESQHGAGKRGQPPRVGHRDGERAALNAGHRRLNDGKCDAEEILEDHRTDATHRIRCCYLCSSGSRPYFFIARTPSGETKNL